MPIATSPDVDPTVHAKISKKNSNFLLDYSFDNIKQITEWVISLTLVIPAWYISLYLFSNLERMYKVSSLEESKLTGFLPIRAWYLI